jgi:hypothetical protein
LIIGSRPLSNRDPMINSSVPDNQNGNSTATRPDQVSQSSAGSQPANQSCPTIAASKQSKILAQRSGSAIDSTACVKEDDAAILKILE